MKVLLRDLTVLHVDLRIYILVLLRFLGNLVVPCVRQLVFVDNNLDDFDLLLTKILFLLRILGFDVLGMTTKYLSLVGI